jgi:integrase
MALTIYRNHDPNPACKVHKLNLSKDEKRFYRDCDCWIWITGTTDAGDIYTRRTLKTKEWSTAEAIVRKIQGEGKDVALHGPKISECIEKYIDSRQDEIGIKASGQYRLVLKNLQEYAAGKNVYFMQELKADLLEDFRTYGFVGMKGTSKANHWSKVRTFLKDAYRRDWITHPIVDKVKTQVGIYEEKLPYSEDEITTILDGAGKLNGGVSGFATKGKTFRLLIELMLETGMRVSDAVAFNPAKVAKSKMWVYTFVPGKTRKNVKPKPMEVYLTDRLKTAIDGCEWFSSTFPFAYRSVAKKDEPDYLAQAVYERMQEIGKRIGVEDCRPHRLRDTFAVRKLIAGHSLEDVSQLLGHASIAVTQRYYAPWVPNRKLGLQDRLMVQSLNNPV